MFLLFEFLRKIDFFGKKIEFQIDKNAKFKTVLGGFFSILHISVFLFLFFSLGYDMMNRTTPIVVVSEEYSSHPARTLIGKNSYFFMFGMQKPDTYEHFFDDSIYKITLQQISYNGNDANSRKTVDIPYERCTEDHVPDELKVDYINAVYGNLSNLVCIKKGYDNGTFFLEGTFTSSSYADIQIYISACVNTSEANNCQSEEVIYAHLKNGNYALYPTDNIIDLRNFEKPAVKKVRDYSTPTTLDIKTGIIRYESTSHIHSDDGWIIDDLKDYHYNTFSENKENFVLYSKDDKDKKIVDHIIRKATIEKTYTRHYKKIQNVFAEMGGFFQLSFLFFYFLSIPFVNKIYYDSIINQLYNFQTNEEKNRDEAQKKLFETKTIIDSERNIGKKNLRELKIVNEMFQPKESSLHVTFGQYLCNFLFGSRNNELKTKIEQRKIGINNLMEKLDLTFILKKFNELEKLKILLLNEDQYYLFNFFPKPIIMKNGNVLLNCSNPYDKKPSVSHRKSEIISNMDNLSKSKIVKGAYKNIINKRVHDNIDTKLIELLDEDIKFLLHDKNNNKLEKDYVLKFLDSSIDLSKKSVGGDMEMFSKKIEGGDELMSIRDEKPVNVELKVRDHILETKD